MARGAFGAVARSLATLMVLLAVVTAVRRYASKDDGAPAFLFEWAKPLEGQVAAPQGVRNYYVVFDDSGSMEEQECSDGRSKEAVAKEALAAFVKRLPAGANLGLLAFDAQGVHERLPLGAGNTGAFLSALASVRSGGSTPLRTAIGQGLQALSAQAASQLGYGEYHLVVVTDGLASEGEDPSPVVDYTAAHTPVVIHTIGFCIGARHSLNRPGLTLYREAKDPGELAQGLEEVLAEASSFDALKFER